jgi:hypothetical protein
VTEAANKLGLAVTKVAISTGGLSVTYISEEGAAVTVPGGATTQVQFNDAGAFAGDPQFTYDKAVDALGIKLAYVYNLNTDASNYERMKVGFDANYNSLSILSTAAGAGVIKPLAIGVEGFQNINLVTGGVGSVRWIIRFDGHFFPNNDALIDIGLDAQRPRKLYTRGSRVKGVRVVTAAGAITVAKDTDHIVIVNKTTGAASAVALYATPETGSEVVIKDGKGDAATNNITISPAAGNIDGAATLVMNVNYQSKTLVYNGTQWNAL